MIVYDVETIRPIINKNMKTDPKYQYATGWDDYNGMGISVACFYDYDLGDIITLTKEDFDNPDQRQALQTLIDKAGVISGFNIKKFDNNLLLAHGISVPAYKCYDLLENIWFAAGLNPLNYDKRTHGGYSLEKVLAVNFSDVQKTMNGVHAPFMWQDGKHQEVIEYCKNDVMVEKALLDLVFTQGGIIDPKTKKFIKMAIPRG